MTDLIASPSTFPAFASTDALPLSATCPVCGDPYIGGPGCGDACAATCGECPPGGCTEECWNPLGLPDGGAA